ncbi:MAG: hypothetical protein Q8O94_02965 [bacterium]|nr:hypothetical protein [bacterium]
MPLSEREQELNRTISRLQEELRKKEDDQRKAVLSVRAEEFQYALSDAKHQCAVFLEFYDQFKETVEKWSRVGLFDVAQKISDLDKSIEEARIKMRIAEMRIERPDDRCEIVAIRESDDLREDSIVGIVKKGYTFNDGGAVIIRKAQVMVGTSKKGAHGG